MSIEVRIPEEIADYKEKIIGSLSIRQLICGGIAIASSVAAYFIIKPLLSSSVATYCAMFVAIPSFCMGWFKSKDGYQFEDWIKIKVYALFATAKRKYEIDDENALPIEVEDYRQDIQNYLEKKRQKEIAEKNNQKRGVNVVGNKKAPKPKSKSNLPAREHFLVKVTEKSIKNKRKTTRAAIKTAARITRKTKFKKGKAS